MLYVLVDNYKEYPNAYDKRDFESRFEILTYMPGEYRKNGKRYEVKKYRDSVAVLLGGYPYPNTEGTQPVPYWDLPDGKCYEKLEDAKKALEKIKNDKRRCWHWI